MSKRVALVTGGMGGLGTAICRALAEDGFIVVANCLPGFPQKDEWLVQNKAAGFEFHAAEGNVSDYDSCNEMVRRIESEIGPVDVLVNNAGIVHRAEFLELTEEDFDRVLRVNLKGSFLTGQAVARFMVEKVEKGGAAGSIINMSSVNATLAIPNQVPYSISKGGVSQLTRVMALSLAPHGIRVNAIGPGSIMTDMLANVNDDPASRTRLLSRTPLGRIGEPSEIASIAAFLASDDASYVTGQTIYADGGRLPLNYTVAVKPE